MTELIPVQDEARKEFEDAELAALGEAPRPRIAIALDRSWKHRLGMHRFTYFRLLRRAGGDPWRVDYGTGPEPGQLVSVARRIVKQSSGLLLSGGSDVDPQFYRPAERASSPHPRRDRFELALIDQARERGIPILGVCRGCQLLNVAHGGTLRTIRHDPQYRRYHNRILPHPVVVDPASRLAGVLEAQWLSGVRSVHGQCVDDPGDGLRIVAQAPDGIAEAIEAPLDQQEPGGWVFGVQWHPELMWRENTEHRLIREFVAAARLWEKLHR